jgi:hypothetical protein
LERSQGSTRGLKSHREIVCTHGTTREPINGLSLTLILRSFTNISGLIEIFVKTGFKKRALYMKRNILYNAHLELEPLNIGAKLLFEDVV